MVSLQPIVIDKFGTKGFVDAAGRNKAASYFLLYVRNARIENGSLTVRPGYREIVNSTVGTYIKGITANGENGKVYVSTNGGFKQVDIANNVLVDIGSVGNDVKNNYIEYGKYTIILTGDDFPYVYDGTTLTKLTASNIASGVNPHIGVAFSGFTAIAGNTADTDNVLYFSRPITLANQEYCYDWVGTGSEQLTLQSPIVGLVGTLSNLFVFTKNTIEYLDKNSLTTIGGTASLFLTPIGEGDELLSQNCAVGAKEKVFYITKSLDVKTVNYVAGTVDRGIGDLSNRALASIKTFLKNIDPDQSDAFGYRIEEKVYWHLKEKGSAVNNIVLIYDIENDSWLVDNNKYYSGLARLGEKYYAGSVLNSNVYEDETGSDDDEGGIPFELRTQALSFGNPVREKMFRGWEIAGEMNYLTNLNVETIVDGNTENSLNILGSEEATTPTDGIGSEMIGGETIGGDADVTSLVAFQKVADYGDVRVDGKTIQLIITESAAGSEFYIDYLSFMLQASGPYQLSDKL